MRIRNFKMENHMARKIICLSLGAIILSACGSAKVLDAPNSLPANWQMEDAPLPGRYSQGSLRGVSYQENLSYGGIGHEMVRPASQLTSLWTSSPKSLFGDRRANQLGDIVTVVIELDEEAELENTVSTNRNNSNSFNLRALFGLPQKVNGILPAGASLSPAVDIANNQNLSGKGTVSRKEKMTLRLAARVNAVLPNGYLGLIGRQEIMVNNEVRHLQVTGLVRIQDISRLNTITYDKIAEARIYYGGQGQLTNSVKPKLGNKLLGALIPF